MRKWLILGVPAALLALVLSLATQSLLLGIALTVITVLSLLSMHLLGHGCAKCLVEAVKALKDKDWREAALLFFYAACCFIGIFLVFGFGLGLAFAVLGV